MAEPLVSILINNYNYGRFLRDAIDSALNQTYSRFEVIVVDDGSTDESRDIIASYGSKVIPILKPNGGQASAFNTGVAASGGDILCFLDSDDYFYPQKVARVVKLFDALKVPKPLMVHHRLKIGQESGEPPQEEFFGRTHQNPLNLAEYARKYKFMQYSAGATTGISINRRMADALFPVPENIRVSADDFIVYGSSLIGELHCTTEPLGVYRVHGKNHWYSGTRRKSAEFANTLDRFLNEKLKENNLPGRISYAESMYAWWDLAADERWAVLAWRMVRANVRQHDRHTLGFTYRMCVSSARQILEKACPSLFQHFSTKT